MVPEKVCRGRYIYVHVRSHTCACSLSLSLVTETQQRAAPGPRQGSSWRVLAAVSGACSIHKKRDERLPKRGRLLLCQADSRLAQGTATRTLVCVNRSVQQHQQESLRQTKRIFCGRGGGGNVAGMRMSALIWRLLRATLPPILAVGSSAFAVGLDERGDEAGGGAIGMREGFVVQEVGCPQAISHDEALARTSDHSWPGGVLNVTSLETVGRSGNHYMAISAMFSLAYCCGVKVLQLPDTDYRFPTEEGGEFKSSKHLFTFSSNGTDGVEAERQTWSQLTGLEDLQGRVGICPKERIVDGTHANHITGLGKDLQTCIRHVHMRGCEAAYLQQVIGDERSCPDSPPPPVETDGEPTELVVPGTAGLPSERKGDGHLVVHIRSQDIFSPDTRFHQYGQPPLGYFLAVIASKKWDYLSVLTSGPDKQLNPTYSVIAELNRQGYLGTNVGMHKDRSFWVDLQTMLCADNLALSHSTLSNLLLAHSRAKRFFLPWGCEPQPWTLKLNRFVNASMICLQRPEVQVYGIDWRTTKDAYTVYDSWDPNSNMMEMVVSDAVKGVQRCCN
ncbi:conserved unknown protein [Ectocarpus siliculosus]|uniref:Uncharacterized protein n=1 Tax=Ectocarpus siliculosus TaxID=2880 RepID=D7FHC1_ECTSI|nr:conserved unknown protein [Ectocarpus siliculosus]|eukprot:CBJ28488.1 conserved unknown protein [Ectocarpus siliculosus]